MCGRFHRFASIQEIATQFNAKPRGELLAPPNYNAAPQDWHPVIRLNEDGEREILNMRWGFLSKEAGVIFISVEDENGLASIIVTPDLYEREKSIVENCKFIIAEGPLQKQDGIIHVKAVRLRSMFDQTLKVHSHAFH